MCLHNTPAAVWDEDAGLDTRLHGQYQQQVSPLAAVHGDSSALHPCPAVDLSSSLQSYTTTQLYIVQDRGQVKTMTKCTFMWMLFGDNRAKDIALRN